MEEFNWLEKDRINSSYRNIIMSELKRIERTYWKNKEKGMAIWIPNDVQKAWAKRYQELIRQRDKELNELFGRKVYYVDTIKENYYVGTGKENKAFNRKGYFFY